MGIILVLSERSEGMDEKALKDLFDTQGKAIATLAVRITTLEELLLEKNIISEAEVATKTLKLSHEFVARTHEAFRKEAEEENKQKKIDE
jgi:hypothetical protein